MKVPPKRRGCEFFNGLLAGTLLAARTLCEAPPVTTVMALKRIVNETIRAVAKRLGNTVAVCRKSYIHPGVIDAFMRGELTFKARTLRHEEATILKFVRLNVLPDLI